MSAETIESAAADAAAAPLDLLLTDAALGVLNRVNPGGSGLRLAAALAARPRLVAGRTRTLLGELTRIAAGTSQVQPSRRDRRFADPGWAGNPLLRRALQAYLAAAQTAEGLAQDADLDWSDTERAGFVLTNLIDALAPSNNPVLNPAALKAAIDTGGGSALAGLRHFAADMASPPRIPSMVEPDAFKVGVDLAVTPGAVVGADRSVRADPVPPGHRSGPAGPATDRPADDQQVLRDRPGPRPQPGRVPGRQRLAGVHDVLAQPGLPARQVGLQHLRAGGARRDGRSHADHAERADRDHRGLLGRHHRRHGGRAPGAHRPAGPDRRADPDGHRAGPVAGRPGQRRHRASGPPGWPRPHPPPAATWTAGRWPRCSPGCGRTT